MSNYFLTVSGSKDKSHGQFMAIRVQYLSMKNEDVIVGQRSRYHWLMKPTSSGDEDVIIFWRMFIRSSDSYCAWCNGRQLRSRSGRVRE